MRGVAPLPYPRQGGTLRGTVKQPAQCRPATVPARAVRLAGLAGLLLTTGCGARVDAFDPVTTQGLSVSNLFWIELILSTLLFLLVAGILTVSIVRFRGRPGQPEPPQVHGNRRLEIAWTSGAILLLAAMFVLALQTMGTVDAAEQSSLNVQVVGHQWWWEFIYPDAQVTTANELHLPVGTHARIQLTSVDVIHSFWVPQFGWMRDAIPGKTNVMQVTVDRAGDFVGGCTQFCGIQHAWMRDHILGDPPDQFQAWLNAQRQPAPSPTDALAQRGQQVFQSNTCVNCHTIRGTSAAGRVGPDLTHFGSRATLGGGILDNTPENVARWVRNPQEIKPGVLMPPFASLSSDDLRALAAYLDGLK